MISLSPDIPVCSGKTVVKVDKHKVLLGLHKAPYLKHNNHWLLSTGQARRVWYVGQQHPLPTRWRTTHCWSRWPWDLLQLCKLDVTDGLLTPTYSGTPTPDELESLPTVWLTSADPWDPSSLEVPDKLSLAFHGQNLWGYGQCPSLYIPPGKKQPPDYNTFREQPWLATYRHHQENVQRHYPACWDHPVTVTLTPTHQGSISSAQSMPTFWNLCHGHVVQFDTWLGRHYLCTAFCGEVQSLYLCLWHADWKQRPCPLSKISLGSMEFPTYYHVTTTQRCKLVWLGNDILRKYSIKAEAYSNPIILQQNPAERRIKTVKTYTSKIMDCTGAPSWNVVPLSAVFSVPS